MGVNSARRNAYATIGATSYGRITVKGRVMSRQAEFGCYGVFSYGFNCSVIFALSPTTTIVILDGTM
jgi:hypothetical protein